ncbi:hypothetical protein BKA65DRAFT_234358 [Rhexocercosporidium sp. MPI-PUGE-AT-0058]|nr:hypothetical protein BKA65DRAFT_234358 [Rhexocercosporidium sp. MPI-PUGE-AT-0058]
MPAKFLCSYQANKSSASLMQHLGGVGAILKGRGVEKVQTSTSRRTFFEYRAIQLAVDLVLRQASFLSSPDWIEPPWKQSEPQSNTRLQTAVDIAFSIPVLMQNFDTVRQLAQASDNPNHSEDLFQLVAEALGVQEAFDRWDTRSRGIDGTNQLYIPRLVSSIEKPQVGNIGSIYPVSFTFSNWDTASALVYYEMSRIYLNGLLIHMEACFRQCNSNNSTSVNAVDAKNLTSKSIACADRICHSIEWFFEDHKRMIGRMVILAPFEAARGLFAQLCEVDCVDPELNASLKQKAKFCETVTQKIKDGGLPAWEG